MIEMCARRTPKERMLRALLASAGIHLGLALALLAGIPPLSVEPTVEVELVVANNPEGQVVDRADTERHDADLAPEDRRARKKARGARAARPRAVRPPVAPKRVRQKAVKRTRRPVEPRPKPPGESGGGDRTDRRKQPGPPRELPPTSRPDQQSCLLSMRKGCKASSEGNPRVGRAAPVDRLASFRPRRSRATAPPRVVGRTGYAGLELARYEDGGRLLRATGKRNRRPGRGELGLLTLASHRIGGRSGRQACNPYRGQTGEGHRTLVLLVDTSGSVVAGGRAPDSIVCAAGAALGALSRGYAVAVANFSSSVWYLRRTRKEDQIYSVLSRFQGEGTRLPPASLLRADLTRKVPRDFVLVSDTAIHNLGQVLPGYTHMFRADRRNRALLYVLGSGVACVKCADKKDNGELCKKCEVTTTDQVRKLERAGFVADRVQRPDDELFHSFVLNSLWKGSPGALLWGKR